MINVRKYTGENNMKNIFIVNVFNKQLECDNKTKLIDLIPESNKKDYLCAKVDNRIHELTYEIRHNCNVDFLTIENEEAMVIYENSLRYILAMALYEINPELSLKLSYYESRSIYGIILNNDVKITEAFLSQINQKMQEIVSANYLLERKIVPNEEAKLIYEKFNMQDKIDLLKYRPEKTVHFYVCNNYYNYMYGYMVPSTGYITKWKIQKYQKGFIIQYPRSECHGEIPPFISSPKFGKTLDDSYRWARMVSTDTVCKINHHVEASGDVDFINLCEAHHNNMLSDLGRQIKKNIQNIRLICIAGPSSSGKTTFANRLKSELLSYGIHPIRISLDDYYLDKNKVPKDEDGQPDLESLEALDIPLFNQNMRDLIDGKEVTIPKFDFKIGHRVVGPTYKIAADQLIIIEGIHALNERLTYLIPKKQKYKIYIAPQEQINLDNHNPVSLTNIRLIRRIVRDYKFRNASPELTLSMWPSVRRGEFKWIYQTQEDADFVFNSLLFYEHCVLKKDAMTVLKNVNYDSPYYIQANSLIKYIKYFIDMDAKWVPCNSLLQEFIGNSCYAETK